MQEHDILILPSNYDGWGAVVNEALQNGMRVIVSENCGANVLVDGESRGEVFYFHNKSKGLKATLEKWIKKGGISLDERREIASWAQNHISGRVAAVYFLEIVEYIFKGSKDRPVIPWYKEL